MTGLVKASRGSWMCNDNYPVRSATIAVAGWPGNCRRPRAIVAEPRRRHDGDMAPVDQTIIQAKVTLQDIEPPIWRRLLLPPSLNLAELHHVLQAVFGWRDEHLHEFIIGGLVYGAPELADEAAAEDDPRTLRGHRRPSP